MFLKPMGFPNFTVKHTFLHRSLLFNYRLTYSMYCTPSFMTMQKRTFWDSESDSGNGNRDFGTVAKA